MIAGLTWRDWLGIVALSLLLTVSFDGEPQHHHTTGAHTHD